MSIVKTYYVGGRLDPSVPRTIEQIRELFPDLPARYTATYLLVLDNGIIKLVNGQAPHEISLGDVNG